MSFIAGRLFDQIGYAAPFVMVGLLNLVFAVIGAEYLLKLLPRGTHDYRKFLRPSELARFCREADLQLEATRGMEYNPLTQRYWLSGDTSVNYLLACRKGL